MLLVLCTTSPVVLTLSAVLGAHLIAVEATRSGDHGGPPHTDGLSTEWALVPTCRPWPPHGDASQIGFIGDMNRAYKGLTEVAPMHIQGISVTVTTSSRLLVRAA